MGRVSLKRVVASLVFFALIWFQLTSVSVAQDQAFQSKAEALAEGERLNDKVLELFNRDDYKTAMEVAEQVLAIREQYLGPDHPDTATSLFNLAWLYRSQGAYAKSENAYIRALDIREKTLGPDDADLAETLNDFAELYREQAEYAKAEPLYIRALDIRERALGSDHTDTAESLNNLAEFYRTQAAYAKAEPLYLRALSINEKALGPGDTETGINLNNLALLYESQGAYARAEPLLIRALKIDEMTFGPDHPSTGVSLNNLALVYESQGAYAKAEPLYFRALDIAEKSLRPDHPDVALGLNNLARLYRTQGAYAKAEPLFLRALSINEKALGPDHPSTGAGLINLGKIYENRGAYTKAEPLYLRALDIAEKALGPDHPSTAGSLVLLARLYENQGAYHRAEPLYLRALDIREKSLGPNHPFTGHSLVLLAGLYDSQSKAEPLYLRALNIFEKALGSDHPSIAVSLNDLATLYVNQGAYQKAEALLLRALDINLNARGSNHPETATVMSNLATLYEDQGNYVKAQSYSKLAVEVFQRRALMSSDGNTLTQSGSADEIRDQVLDFYYHALNSRRVADEDISQADDLASEAYSSSQYALRTTAGAALGQAAARFAASDDSLADIVRSRQDLSGEWSFVDEALKTSLSSDPELRNKDQEQSYRDRLPAIDKEIAEMDLRLEADFPEYFALTSPKPLSLEETQELLYDNEALVMFLAGDEGTLVFAVTKDKVDWTLVNVDASVLDEAVRVLRVSLENPQSAFPRGQAHGIYKRLMGEVEDVVSDKEHVFVVPSGALGSIPLGVLVTENPEGDDRSPDALRVTKWWGTQQALTTLPSISSLKALRLLAKDGRGKEPFAGFGNPVLDGPKADNDNRSIKLASRGTASYFRGKYGDVDAIRTLAPLPQTETELLSLASVMHTKPKQSLWMGKRATEANLKKADLSEKRVLAFATHGLMSGEMSGLAEPALVLTPPQEATDADDGLLTASEAALLNLNADWVILSACNTAAADEPGADGLSGLARSFFYAGARSMLVSHWPVRDAAAARLTTTAITLQDQNPDLGRSEALRRSMLVLMNDTSDPSLAHPSAWAPFVIVGEGGSAVSVDPKSFDPKAVKMESLNIGNPEGITSAWALIGGMILVVVGLLGFVDRRRKLNEV